MIFSRSLEQWCRHCALFIVMDRSWTLNFLYYILRESFTFVLRRRPTSTPSTPGVSVSTVSPGTSTGRGGTGVRLVL